MCIKDCSTATFLSEPCSSTTKAVGTVVASWISWGALAVAKGFQPSQADFMAHYGAVSASAQCVLLQNAIKHLLTALQLGGPVRRVVWPACTSRRPGACWTWYLLRHCRGGGAGKGWIWLGGADQWCRPHSILLSWPQIPSYIHLDLCQRFHKCNFKQPHCRAWAFLTARRSPAV